MNQSKGPTIIQVAAAMAYCLPTGIPRVYKRQQRSQGPLTPEQITQRREQDERCRKGKRKGKR